MRAWLLVVVTTAVDQASKLAAQAILKGHGSVPVIPPFVQLTYVENTGAAFGMLQGQVAALIVISVIVSAWLIQMVRKSSGDRSSLWALAVILGGALGNLLDRLRLGFVVDFLDLRVWPVFNLADSAITVGIAWLLWQAVRPVRPRP